MPNIRKKDIDKIDVAYVANLARIKLTSAELVKFQEQLDQILGYVRKIGELNLAGIEPTSHAVRIDGAGRATGNVFREDRVRPGLDRETALKNAPAIVKDQYKVPKIVE